MVELPTWVAILFVLAVPVGAFAAKAVIKSYIEKRVTYGFDRQLEEIRADLRSGEERLKSDLRKREGEIALLREGVLAGRANRLAIVEKRRIEGAEKLWLAVTKLSRMKQSAMSLSVLKLEAIAKRAPTDPQFRELIKTLSGPDLEKQMAELKADEERPFISPLTWALYSAYSSIILGAYLVLRVISSGVEDPLKMINEEKTKTLLKSLLPHQSSFIDSHDSTVHFHLLDEIENRILSEIQNSFEGHSNDADNAKRAAEILNQVAALGIDQAASGGQIK